MNINEEQLATHEHDIVESLNHIIADHVTGIPPQMIAGIFASSAFQIIFRREKNLSNIYLIVEEIIDNVIKTGEKKGMWTEEEFYFDTEEEKT